MIENAIQEFQAAGYTIVRGLFSLDETEMYREHFMQLWEAGTFYNEEQRAHFDSGDPLKKYPRIMHPHRKDQISLDWLLDTRLRELLTAMLGREPFAAQTMFYFKPPGARGQALHQDQYYLRVQPGTCIAAWMAVDRCDEENGCLQVVPGSHNLPVLCTVEADHTESFTDVTVPLAEGMAPEAVVMDPGDVLFFNGQVIHGSLPNRTTDRFRRALIAHYIVGEAQKVAEWYAPILRMDGTMVELEASEQGSQCGVWVERDGTPVVEMQTVAGRE